LLQKYMLLKVKWLKIQSWQTTYFSMTDSFIKTLNICFFPKKLEEKRLQSEGVFYRNTLIFLAL